MSNTTHQDRCDGVCDSDVYINYDEAESTVTKLWPEAKHVGMGHWKIARKANIWYTGNPEHYERGQARLRYVPMYG